jgi:hypothetical protein
MSLTVTAVQPGPRGSDHPPFFWSTTTRTTAQRTRKSRLYVGCLQLLSIIASERYMAKPLAFVFMHYEKSLFSFIAE